MERLDKADLCNGNKEQLEDCSQEKGAGGNPTSIRHGLGEQLHAGNEGRLDRFPSSFLC